MKTANELVKFVKTKLGTPYVYGMKGAVLTADKLKWLANQYPSYLSCSKEKGKIGKVCVDCSGLISWCTGIERGSSQLKETARKVLPISHINEAVPGCALWRNGHVGVYIGNGYCIEARGSNYGTVKTKVSDRTFTHILWLKDIDYDSVPKEEIKVDIGKVNAGNEVPKYKAKVVTKTDPLVVRDAPGGNKISSIKKGDVVTVSRESNGWAYIDEYKGWSSLTYLSRVVDSTVSGNKPSYKVGQTYTLQVELKVRTGAGTGYTAKKHSQLTADGKKNDKDGDGALDAGTRVTCLETLTKGNDIWIRTPSGYLAAYYQGHVYIK